MGKTKQFNVRIPEELHTRLKIASARAGRPMGNLVEEAITQLLARLDLLAKLEA